MENYRIAIVGGGIWGLSTAFHLSEMGVARDVVVLERNTSLAAETTPQSAGQVGQLRGDPVLARAVGYTLDLLQGFSARTGHDPAFVQSGSVHLALTSERVAQFALLTAAAREIGYPASPLETADVRRLLPGVDESRVMAAVHVPNDGYVDAGRWALALGAAARDRGVTLRCGVNVQDIEELGNQRIRLTTDKGGMEVEKLVLTAGPWTGQLAARMGVVTGMHPIRLQQARTIAADVPDAHPVIRVPDKSCYIRPEAGGYLFGFFDPDPLPIDLDQQAADFRTSSVLPEPDLIREAVARLRPVFPPLGELEIDTFRQGMMTCTPDGRFVLGPTSEDGRVWLATGCGGTGIAASGAVGRWIAKGLIDGTPGEDIAQYAVHRFGDRVADRQWLRERACATSAAYYRIPPSSNSA